jgi:hypothetical protein
MLGVAPRVRYDPPMRRIHLSFLGLVLVAAPVLFSAVPAYGATEDPCKVLKASEISKVFAGASVSKGKAGLKTAANAQCTYTVAASDGLPEGDVVVIVMFAGAKPAYDGLKKIDGYVPTSGLAKSIYNEKQSVVNTLKGDILLGLQGLFTEGSLPITYEDVQAQLVQLSKVGLKRV